MVDWAFKPRYDNRSTRRKTINSNLLNSALKIDLELNLTYGGRVRKYTHAHKHVFVYIYI